jgi:hypothetical protein
LSRGLVFSYAVLCLLQAALVAAPVRRRHRGRLAAAGFLFPTAALCFGVGLLRLFSVGATALALLAAVGAPLLAALSGRLLGWRRPWLMPVFAAALCVDAWQVRSPIGEVAGLAIIGLACLAIAAAVASTASRRSIEVGLVVLALVDLIAVWGTPQVGPATAALDRASLPTLSLPFLAARPLPSLQDASFGSALMGWLDLLAPALLATTLVRGERMRAAVAAGAAAGAWGLLLTVTTTVPATVPVVVGLLVARLPTQAPGARLASHSFAAFMLHVRLTALAMVQLLGLAVVRGHHLDALVATRPGSQGGHETRQRRLT